MTLVLQDTDAVVSAEMEELSARAGSFKPFRTFVKMLRSALQGALVGLGPVVGAGGSYNFSEDAAGTVGGGVLADSLVLAARRGGSFWPLP